MLKKSIIAGGSISIGAFAYMIVLQKTGLSSLASCVFFVGLLLVFLTGSKLFTGCVLTMRNNEHYWCDLTKVWFGNLVGSVVITLLLYIVFPDLNFKAILDAKLDKSFLELIISGFFCNIFVCGAVYYFIYFSDKEKFGISWFLITLFVAMGLEHSIANQTYMTLAMIKGYSFMLIIVNLVCTTLGNLLGGLAFYECVKEI